ncbi:hypothetical protein [Streptomyces sp. NPDC057740]|uniref:MmyB family transcriptional regulator n=1 Tax=Streptomyces sp. NPDC057740 TaxID=3346234 RepID=UPI0036A9D9EA
MTSSILLGTTINAPVQQVLDIVTPRGDAQSDVLDEVTERRLTRNLRTVKALTDPTVLEPVITGVTAGSKRRAQCRRSGACPWVSGVAAWTGVTVGLRPLRGRGSRCGPRRSARSRNWARLVFLRPEYRDLFVDWEQKANDVVSQLRMDAGSHPNDPRLSALVGELSVKSEEFRRLWGAHDVKDKCHGIQRLHHPLVGELDLRRDKGGSRDAAGTHGLTTASPPESRRATKAVLRASGSGAVGLATLERGRGL